MQLGAVVSGISVVGCVDLVTGKISKASNPKVLSGVIKRKYSYSTAHQHRVVIRTEGTAEYRVACSPEAIRQKIGPGS
jgi:hypothetical protein